jgi:hypothetical protein
MTICDLCDWLRPRTIARGSFVLLAAALATVIHNPTASAQAEDQATARTLFNDARELMKTGNYEQACPKLEAANKLYSGSGILLNLGDCYEHIGRTASAWTEFGEAASAAERLGRAVDQAEARKRQSAIEPKLSRLSIHVNKEAPGLLLKRDGTALDHGAWGTAIPIDPGPHTVSAEASGYVTWASTVNVTELGKMVTVEVPELQPTPASPAPPPPPAPTATEAPAPAPAAATTETPHYWTGRRVVSALVTGVGGVGMGVGGILGLVAKSKFTTAQGEGQPAQDTDSKSAVNTANVATVFVVAGAVVAAGGLVFWLTAPSADVQVGASGQGVLVRGAF